MSRTSRQRKKVEIDTSDDAGWSDVENDGIQASTQSPQTSRSRSSTPRKRRGTARPIHVLSQRKPIALPQQQREDKYIVMKPTTSAIEKNGGGPVTRESAINWMSNGTIFIGRYIVDVLSTAAHLLRKPLGLLVFFLVLARIMSGISSSLRTVMSPLCILPGISSSAFCNWNVARTAEGTRWADFPSLMDVQSKTFEQLLDESAGGSGLSLEIKKAEMATGDLVTLVRASNLRTKDMLSDALTDFIGDAKKTGRGLQKLNSKIGGSVDSIMAVNDWALHTIEATQSTNSRFDVMGLIPWFSRAPSNEAITETFIEAMNTLSINMRRLILEAEVNIRNLEELEERMSMLHDILTREDSSISSAKEELLSELWTMLGGNKKTLRGFNQHLSLLKNLGEYRKQALVHVVTALQALQAMSEDMEDLRERVAAPELVGSRIPVEVHMKSIRNGLERLKEGRMKSKVIEEATVRRILGIDSSGEIESASR